MKDAPIELGPGRLRVIQAAACAVSRGLAGLHGRRQFYMLSQVQAAVSAVDIALLAWIHALFVTRDDFGAYFAMRETPGRYEQLRAAMSRPEARGTTNSAWHRSLEDPEVDLGDLWDLLDRAADL